MLALPSSLGRYNPGGGHKVVNSIWLAVMIVVLCMIAYLAGVWLATRLSIRLRSVSFIKVLHLAVFVAITVILLGFLYEVGADEISYLTWGTIGIFLGEGIVLMTNRWRCPLTAVAEDLGSQHGQVTDILLPKIIADNVWSIYTWLFAGGFLVLLFRLVT
jgi:hypothetical protein